MSRLAFLFLLALGLAGAQGGPWKSLTVPAGGQAGFSLLTPPETGVNFTNLVPESRHLTNQMLLNGSGVALGDADADGRCDVFLAALSDSALFRNLGGWRFTNVTADSFATPLPADVTGCAFADLDGDRSLDLVLNTVARGTHVLFNDGHGHFAARFPALNAGRGGTTIAIADVDGNGFLDLYICNYRADALMDKPNARATFRKEGGQTLVATVDGRPATAPEVTNRYLVAAEGRVVELGEADVLYRNLGGTNFAVVPWTGGAFLDVNGRPLTETLFDWSLSAAFRDLNGDGRPDLYVGNDFQWPDRLWLNESKPGEVRFRAAPRGTFRHTSRFTMGLDFADVNRDNLDDLLALDMVSRDPVMRLTQIDDMPADMLPQFRDPLACPQVDANVLQLNRGDGTFAEIAAFAGLIASDWSWSLAFLDVDLDGWEDVLITNGAERAARDADVAFELRRFRAGGARTDAEFFQARRKFPRYAPPKFAFRNLTGERGEVRFAEIGASWGFAMSGVAQGIALGDLDGDGDQDVVVNQFNGPAWLFRNNSSAPRISVSLLGSGPNSHGVGARIVVRGGPVGQSQEIIAGSRYLSGDEPRRVFAAGSAAALEVEVRWPSGRISRLADLPANSVVEIAEADSPPAEPPAFTPPPPVASGLFQSLSVDSGASAPPATNRVVPPASDELARQTLLPRRLTTLGPGVSWLDLDGDGNDELVVAGSPVRVSRWTGEKFETVTNLTPKADVTMTTVWQGQLLLAESSLAGGATNGATVAFASGATAVPNSEASTGPLALADVDGDGDLDLFVGGRAIPGQWPRAAGSRLFLAEGGKLVPGPAFPDVGLVSGATLVDLDGDGDADLALACEWGPVKLFRNAAGKFSAWDPPVVRGGTRLPLSALTGWWTSMAPGDFDGDGKLDLLAGNWGENSFYELYRDSAALGADATPLQIFHGVLDDPASYEVLEAYGPPDAALPVRSLARIGPALPWLVADFRTFRAFARARLPAMLGDRAHELKRLEARWLATTLFLNRGDHLEIRPLPPEAQYTAVFGVAVADFNGDGREDAFLAGNYFGHSFGMTRDDAGQGLLLLGDGQGSFRALSAAESGIAMPGEGRGAAVCDFDGDGRADLAVGQQGGPTQVFRNQSAPAGLRLRLRGGPENPLGYGATVRLRSGGRSGPVRAVSAGAGYWSVNSGTLVFQQPEPAADVEVQWPDGIRTVSRLPVEARRIEVARDGTLREVR